ncbi:MetQ/NlpA family ABC transporter substrate-binding protein [Fructilactobacillus frigidiflavus]|uniref:MetQ/NlpA family ABC transporter substrate-binding protein n=1 Tax=Fructilactobacillus frigidiflavus TaxID=3242688 RepID=UPI003757DA5F
MKKKSWIWIGILVLIVAVGYFSFGSHGKNASKDTITVGLMSGSKPEQQIWDTVAKTAKDKYGLTVKYKYFSDYSQPNAALTSKSVDVNAFQNYPFMDTWNDAHHTHIVAVGDTIIEPMRIYSYKFNSVKDLPDGATIAVPNDANNESRALHVLQSAGLIKLNNDKLANLKSITDNPKNLKIKEVDASQTSRSLKDVDAAVVNGNYAQTANLNIKKAIYTEEFNKDSHKWINFIAANQENKDDPKVKKLVKAYQNKATAKEIKKVSGVNQLPAWNLNLK